MRKLFTALFSVWLGLSLLGCSDSADEKKIQDTMQAMRDAIQNHDKHAFMKHVAPRYRGQYHGTRPVFEAFIMKQLKNNKNIYIYMADTTIEIKDGLAKVIFYAGAAGGPDQMPEHGQLFKVQTHWKPYNGAWQLTNARWRPALTFPDRDK